MRFLILLTILGLILRLYQVGEISIWGDEAIAFYRSQQSFMEIWGNPYGDINPPLFFWIEHIVLLLGSTEFFLRLAPAIFGALTIPLVYLVGKEFYDRDVGIIAAALLTFSLFHIWYSQEARPYTLLLFLSLVALFFYLKAIYEDHPLYWILFGLFTGLAFWAHNAAIIIIPSLGIWFLISRFRQPIYQSMIKPAFLSIGAFLLIVLPLFPYLIGSYTGKIGESPTWGFQGPELIYQIIVNFFVAFPGSNHLTIYTLIILFFVGLIQLFRINFQKFLFLVLAISIPLILGYWISYTTPTVPRYFIIILVFFELGITFSFIFLKRYLGTTKFLSLVILFITIVSFLPLQSYYSYDYKWDYNWKGINNKIQEITKEGDVIVLVPHRSSLSFSYYYDNIEHGTIIYYAVSPYEIEEIVLTHPKRDIFFICNNDRLDSYQWIEKNSTFIKKYGNYYIYKLNKKG